LNPATILKQAAADGVTLSLAAAGTIKAAGDKAAVARWAAAIREHKPGIVALLQGAANDDQQAEAVAIADPDLHQRWTVAIPGRDPFGVIVPQGITLQQMRVQYPTATSILVQVPQDCFPATSEEVAELRQLIDTVLAGSSNAERREALQIALGDVQDALICWRALAADRGGL
jgi:hypothetical protein